MILVSNKKGGHPKQPGSDAVQGETGIILHIYYILRFTQCTCLN